MHSTISVSATDEFQKYDDRAQTNRQPNNTYT